LRKFDVALLLLQKKLLWLTCFIRIHL